MSTTTTDRPRTIDKIAVNRDGVWTRSATTGLWTCRPDFFGRVTALQAAFEHLDSGKWLIDAYNGAVVNTRTGRMIGHPTIQGYIYLAPYLTRDGKHPHLKVSAHRVIWQRFNGPIPNHLEVNHLDGVKGHNALANMELVTGAQNIQHAVRTGLKGHHARLTPDKVREVRQVHGVCRSYKKTAEQTGVTIRQAKAIAQRVTFRSVD